jgi:hypothetical protein
MRAQRGDPEDEMSWDVSVFASDRPPVALEEMPADWKGALLGSAQSVREAISAVIPEVDWSDPTWGSFRGNGFSLEFNMGAQDPSDGFMIHVRGGGDAVPHLLSLGTQCGWYLLDTSMGEWLHLAADPNQGWKAFRSFRDSIIGNVSKGPKE